MICKLVILTVVFGVVLADPVARASDDSQLLDIEDDATEIVPVRELPDLTLLAFEVLNKVIGVKLSALTLAVGAIEWLVSNVKMIVLGAITTFGFCKLTGKCSLAYEELIPVAQLRSFVTPERLETAERFLVSAVEKYAQKKNGRSLQNVRARL